MRAMAFAQPGGVDVLQLLDLPVPTLEDDEVLVQVKACGLNHLDIWVRNGLPTKIPMPHIGGCEPAGIVADMGKKVRGFTVGQRVLISPGQADRNSDLVNQNLDNLDESFVIHGYQTQGGFAEYSKAKACDVLPISEAWSFTEWAAVSLTFVTAWNMLHHKARVRPNDEVVDLRRSRAASARRPSRSPRRRGRMSWPSPAARKSCVRRKTSARMCCSTTTRRTCRKRSASTQRATARTSSLSMWARRCGSRRCAAWRTMAGS